MAIFDRFKSSKGAERKGKSAKPTKKETDTIPSDSSKSAANGNLMSNTLLRMPHVSEKAARLADRGTYVFRVAATAEKVSVKKAIESLYGVKVDKVRMVTVSGKPVRRGKRLSYRQDMKKALVTLKKGQTIAMYEGV